MISTHYKTSYHPLFLIVAKLTPLPIDFCQGDGFFDAYVFLTLTNYLYFFKTPIKFNLSGAKYINLLRVFNCTLFIGQLYIIYHQKNFKKDLRFSPKVF